MKDPFVILLACAILPMFVILWYLVQRVDTIWYFLKHYGGDLGDDFNRYIGNKK